jgi:hypothetical protein
MRKVVTSSALSEAGRFALDKSLNIVMQQAINGAALLLFNDKEDLKSSLSLLEGHARILMLEIEKMKKSLAEPENKPTTHPALSIESQLQNLTLDALSES